MITLKSNINKDRDDAKSTRGEEETMAMMDNSSSRKSSRFSKLVPSLHLIGNKNKGDDGAAKERHSWAGLLRSNRGGSNQSLHSNDDDSNKPTRNSWAAGLIRNLSNTSILSDDSSHGDHHANKPGKNFVFPKRVSQFLGEKKDNSGRSRGRSPRRHEVGASWAHQTVKIQPKMFVTEHQGRLEDDYEVGRLLGEGGFGQVFECFHKETGAGRAVKKMILNNSEHEGADTNAEMMEEFAVLRELEHPNILKNYAIYQGEEHFSVVTDVYKGGDLLNLILERRLSEAETAQLIKHVLSCINYCHINGIVHRDLKPDNILLEETHDFRDIKIIDFGLAAKIQNSSDRFSGTTGSLYYMSPQILEGSYTKACDIWAIGVICYMLMSGYAPFDGDDVEEVFEQIREGTVYFDDDVWDDISDDALDFVEYLLTVSEERRPTAEEALKHKWLKQFDEEEEANNKDKRSIQTSWEGLKHFSTDCKLKQVAYSLIASQLLSKHDRECIDHDFRTMDVDCDGKLSQQDLQMSHKNLTGVELPEEELDQIMAAVNYSSSGTIEYSEFVAATMMEKKLVNQEMLTSVFHILDEDNSGCLTVDNIHLALGLEQGSMEDYVLHKIIEPVDSTGIGAISLEDFISMMTSSSSTKTNQKKTKASRRLMKRPTSLTRTFRNTLNTNRIATFSSTVVSGFATGSNNVVAGISSGTQTIVSGIASTSNTVACGISSGSKSVVSGIASGSNTVVSGLSSGSKSVVSGIASTSNTVASGLSSGSKSVASGIASGSNTVASGLSSGSRSVVAGIASTSNTVASGISFGSKSVVSGIASGSNNMVSGLSSGSKSLVANISSLVQSSLDHPLKNQDDDHCKQTPAETGEGEHAPSGAIAA